MRTTYIVLKDSDLPHNLLLLIHAYCKKLIYDYVAYTYDIDVSMCNALRSGTLHMLGDVEFTECSQPWHHVLIGQLQDADGVAILDG